MFGELAVSRSETDVVARWEEWTSLFPSLATSYDRMLISIKAVASDLYD